MALYGRYRDLRGQVVQRRVARIYAGPGFAVELDSALDALPHDDLWCSVVSSQSTGPCALSAMRKVPGEVPDYAHVRNRVVDAVRRATLEAVRQVEEDDSQDADVQAVLHVDAQVNTHVDAHVDAQVDAHVDAQVDYCDLTS